MKACGLPEWHFTLVNLITVKRAKLSPTEEKPEGEPEIQ